MDFDKFLDEVQVILAESQQANLFGDVSALKEQATKLCVTYLKGQGYRVGDPIKSPVNISKLDDLLTVFYSYLRGIYPEHLCPAPNPKRDRAIAKRFVEKRMEADGLDKKSALQQCGYIIQTIFKHRDKFKFETPPSFGILGQGELSWIADRAVRIINQEANAAAAAVQEKVTADLTDQIEKNYTDMGYSSDELENMLGELEAQYGKKESK